MERMAQHTKQPEMLRELFEALGNDPFVIAECLARPTLSERLEASFYAYDQRLQGETREPAELMYSGEADGKANGGGERSLYPSDNTGWPEWMHR